MTLWTLNHISVSENKDKDKLYMEEMLSTYIVKASGVVLNV